jgi:hypothetical protein
MRRRAAFEALSFFLLLPELPITARGFKIFDEVK